MTLTRQIVQILADGPRCTADLMELTGKNRNQVAHALRLLMIGQFAESQPVMYQLTPAGVERSQSKKKPTDPRKLAQAVKRRAAKKAMEEARSRVMSDSLIGIALRSRPALATVWGSA